MQKKYKDIGTLFLKPQILFFCLIWLIFLLVVGTIAQKTIGIYAAQKLYFSSFLFWFGIVPLPGAATVLTLIFITILAKLLFASPWNIKRSGIIVTHIGALLLLLGGGITSIFSYEGSLTLAEGEQRDYISDYHERNLVVLKNDKPILMIPFSNLHLGGEIDNSALPFRIKILEKCQNCDFIERSETLGVTAKYRGAAKELQLVKKPLDLQDERNNSGLLVSIHNVNGGENIHLLSEVIGGEPRINVRDNEYKVSLRRKQMLLPFKIELIDFERQLHPGTTISKNFRSKIKLIDGDLEWVTVIKMNEPLRYKGYTIFQSSFVPAVGTQTSVFAVVKNIGRLFPYISCAVVGLGLLMHVFLSIPQWRRPQSAIVVLIALSCFFLPASAQAKKFDYASFEKIPISHMGRIKPLNTFARHYLQIFSGKTQFDDLSASQWLSEILFDDKVAVERHIFEIRHPDLLLLLGLSQRADPYYSFQEVFDALSDHVDTLFILYQDPQENLGLAQRQLLVLHSKIGIYSDLLENQSLLRIIPPQWGGDEWSSPSNMFEKGQGGPDTVRYMALLSHMSKSYQARDYTQWHIVSSDALAFAYNMGGEAVNPSFIDLEIQFNHFKPFEKSLYFYVGACLLLIILIIFQYRVLIKLAFLSTLVGWLLHSGGVVVRMIIMQRPPVSNLYESILFVSLIVVMFGLLMELRNRDGLGVLIGVIGGVSLGFLGTRYANGGDTLGMLVAVLDTNFWLSTHVVAITIGYGSALVTGMLAHFYMLWRCFMVSRQSHLYSLEKSMKDMCLVALLFTITGTILGGIWADQSWGRFWGWDPKENGALLIVLWLILLLHGRISGQLRTLEFITGLALTNIVVALAWFGVNLLNVGLHSYGFTSGVAQNLALFCIAEFTMIMGLYFFLLCARRSKGGLN